MEDRTRGFCQGYQNFAHLERSKYVPFYYGYYISGHAALPRDSRFKFRGEQLAERDRSSISRSAFAWTVVLVVVAIVLVQSIPNWSAKDTLGESHARLRERDFGGSLCGVSFLLFAFPRSTLRRNPLLFHFLVELGDTHS